MVKRSDFIIAKSLTVREVNALLMILFSGFFVCAISLYLKLPYLIFPVTLFFLYRLNHSKIENHIIPAIKKNELPSVSIVICARNEEQLLPATLKTLMSIKYPIEKLDILIVNHASTDNTANVIKHYQEMHPPIKSIYMPQEVGFKAGIFNFILPTLQGEFIAFFDADSRIPPDIFISTLAGFDDPTVAAIEIKKSCFNREQSIITRFTDDQYQDISRNISGGGALIRKASLIKAGGWNTTTITEDFYMTFQLLNLDQKILFPAKPVVQIEAVSTWMRFLRQRLRWTTGDQICILDNLKSIIRFSFSSRRKEFSAFTNELMVTLYSLFILEYFILGLFTPKFFMYAVALYLMFILFSLPGLITKRNFVVLVNLYIPLISIVALMRNTLLFYRPLKWYYTGNKA